MALVSLSHVSKRFQGPLVLEDVTLDVHPGARIGVIGRNGAGKSTLLRLLAGLETPSAGQVIRGREVRIAFQTQELEAPPERSVRAELELLFEHDRELEEGLRALEQRLGESHGEEQQARLLKEYQALQDALHARGTQDAEQRIAAVLSGLGLPEPAWDQALGSFSGGERNLIALARILLESPDVVLLDEPTNHLDLDGIEWFQRFVRTTPSTIVMVSHDRELLDETATSIWEIDRSRVRAWTGNYSAWLEQKAEEEALQERRYRNQQRLVKRLEFQARRLRDMASAYDDPGQAKRAKAMLKRIEQMETVEKPRGDERSFNAALNRGARHGRIALTIDGYSFRYGERVLFDQASLEVEYGERVALVGPNGSGKSTLFKSILEDGSWENPLLRLGRSVRLGRFHQFHEDAMQSEASLLRWLIGATGLTDRPAADLLHRFLFSRDDLERPISTLSGGEKSRLQLARLVHDEVNFLMLDEPTNHLDIRACEQLEQMLAEFDGTLFIISHDRRFLEKLVDVVVEVERRELVRHRTTFREWAARRAEAAAARSGAALTLHSQKAAAEPAKQERIRERERKKELQRERRRQQKRLARLEDAIEGLEARQAELHAALEAAWSGGDGAGDPEALAAELRTTEAELARQLAAWEEAAAANEGQDPDTEAE